MLGMKKMRRDYKYIIEIKFDTNNSKLLLSKNNIPYYWSKSFHDLFNIYENKIIIEAKRTTNIKNLGSIFENYISSLYLQMIKSIIYYYAKVGTFYKMNNISISVYNSIWNKIRNKTLNLKEFNQPLQWSFKLKYKINNKYIENIFKEDSKWKALLISISNLLIASCNNINASEKFNILWIAFNSLYKEITKKTTDAECLMDIKSKILSWQINLNKSLNVVNWLTVSDIRTPIRFREMILNNYKDESKTIALKDMIKRYTDSRLMQIFKETNLCYREKFLINKWLKTDIEYHINNHISRKTINDNEIVLFLTWIYMYFVRNKNFHWELLNHNLRLTTSKFDNEYDFLNNLLFAYIIDLINNSHLY